MNSNFEPPTIRVYAELYSGEHLVPGAHGLCPGADAFGACPVADLPSGRPCAGATWHYNGAERSWHFEFASDSSVCPAAVLDPLGPIAVGLD